MVIFKMFQLILIFCSYFLKQILGRGEYTKIAHFIINKTVPYLIFLIKIINDDRTVHMKILECSLGKAVIILKMVVSHWFSMFVCVCQWENHAKSLKLEEQTLLKIKSRIQEKVMNNEGTWIDWQYLLDAATLLKKVWLLMEHCFVWVF